MMFINYNNWLHYIALFWVHKELYKGGISSTTTNLQCSQFYLHDFYCNALCGNILHSADQPMHNLSTDKAIGRQAALLWQKLHSSAASTGIQFILHVGDIIEY